MRRRTQTLLLVTICLTASRLLAAPVQSVGVTQKVMPPIVHYRLSAIFSLALSPHGKRLAVGAYRQVDIYDTTSWELLAVCRSVQNNARSIAFSPDGKTVAIGCGEPDESGETLLWDGKTGTHPTIINGPSDTIETLAYTADGSLLVAGCADHNVYIYPQTRGVKPTTLTEHNDRVEAVATPSQAKLPFLTGGLDHTVKAWDPKALDSSIANLDQYGDGITCITYINTTQFVAGCLDGKIYWSGIYYDDRNKDWGDYTFRTDDAHDGGVNAEAFSGNDQLLLTCGNDGTEKLWNMNGNTIKAFQISRAPLYAVALSQDGKTAMGGGRDGYLTVWDTTSGDILRIIAPPALPAPAKPRKHTLLKIKRIVHPRHK